MNDEYQIDEHLLAARDELQATELTADNRYPIAGLISTLNHILDYLEED